MKHILYATFFLITAFSCTPPLYIPNTTNVPTLKEKGDLDLSYSLGTNGNDLQGSYAINDNVGVMLNGSYGSSKSDSNNNFTKHQFLELGGGYTFILNKDKTDETKTIFSAFGGFGVGSASGEYSFSFLTSNVYTNNVFGNYSRAFIQPSIGISSLNVDFFFTFRTSYVNFSDIKNELDQSIINDEYINELDEALNPKKSNVFYEPTLTLNVGGDQLKFMMQAGLSSGLYPQYEMAFRQRPIIFIFGIKSDLNVFK